MNKMDRKLVRIFTKDTHIPAQVKYQTNLAYSMLLSRNSKATDIKKCNLPRKHFNKKVVLVAAVLTLVLGTTAFASVKRLGLNDFFTKYGKSLPEQSTPLVENEVKQEASKQELVSFRVREAVCDSQSIYVVLEAKPIDAEKYLLLALDVMYNDPVANMGITSEYKETLVDYAKRTNRQMLSVHPSLSDNGTYIMHSADCTTEEDGTVVFILKGDNISNKENLTLTCGTTVYPIDWDGKSGEVTKDSFEFQLTNRSTELVHVYQMDQPTIVKNTGVIVDKIELRETELGIYAELTYHLASDATEEMIKQAKDSLCFEFLDEEGNVWKHGLSGTGGFEETSDGVFVQKSDFSLKELPTSITVRAYDIYTKERFGEVTLHK